MLLVDLESLARISFVSKLLRQGLNDIAEAVLQGLVHLSEISLLVKGVLEFLHPSGEFVLQLAKGCLQIIDASLKLSKGFLADSTTAT